MTDEFVEQKALSAKERGQLDDEYALALGRVVIEAARVELTVAELCWTLMARPTVDEAREATESWQFSKLRTETSKLAERSLETSLANQVVGALQRAAIHMNQRGSLAHLVIFRSGPHQIGFRRRGDVRFREVK
ncbi:MAG: hypothetical protein ACRDJ2_16905, partial [Actinomycetota bacterium]